MVFQTYRTAPCWGILTMGGIERMVVVASIKGDCFALEAIVYLFSFALQADQLDLFDVFAFSTLSFDTFHEAKFMSFITINRFQPLLICGDSIKIIFALYAKGDSAFRVLKIKLGCFIAAHTSASFKGLPKHRLKLMLELAHILVNADVLAFQAKVKPTGRTAFWTLFEPLTHAAVGLCFSLIYEDIAALAFFLIIHQSSQMLVVSLLRQSLNAILAYSEIAGLVVVNARIEYGCVHSADIANILQAAILEEGEVVADGASFFGAGRHPAFDAVFLIAFSTDGAAKLLFRTFCANRRNHFVVLSDKELQTVLLGAFVLMLQPALGLLLLWGEGAGEVMLVEIID